MAPGSNNKDALKVVISAMLRLRHNRNSTSKNITQIVVRKTKYPESKAKGIVSAVLRRGVLFGAITKKNGAYYVNDILTWLNRRCVRRKRGPNVRKLRRQPSRCRRSASRRRRRRCPTKTSIKTPSKWNL